MKTLMVGALTLALWGLAGSSGAKAGYLDPGPYAYGQLVFGTAAEHHAAGCLRWNWQQNAWYVICPTMPARAVVVRTRG
jgi:hypothetical protein